MRAAQLVAPGRLEVIEAIAPDSGDLGTGDVLLRVDVGGICGTDIPYFLGRRTPYRDALIPAGPGAGFPLHEVVGTVVTTRHPHIAVGERVVGWASRYDGLAELIIANGDELHAYTAPVEPSRAIVLQPLACVLWAVEQLERSGAVAGRLAAVLGQGPIGLLFSHVLATRGAQVTGVDQVDRSPFADAVGVSSMVTANVTEWAAALSREGRPELVIEAVGHDPAPFAAALAAVAPGGDVYLFGVPDETEYRLPIGDFLARGATLRGGFTEDRRRMLALADDHLTAHPRLGDLLVTDVFDLDRVQEAYERAAAGAADRLKVVVSIG